MRASLDNVGYLAEHLSTRMPRIWWR
jgi:hypothetical protein